MKVEWQEVVEVAAAVMLAVVVILVAHPEAEEGQKAMENALLIDHANSAQN